MNAHCTSPITTTGEEESLIKTMDSSAQGRFAIWKAGMELFYEKPWFGHGYGEFPRRVGKYNPLVARRDPHSTYLGIAAEMGAFALGALIITMEPRKTKNGPISGAAFEPSVSSIRGLSPGPLSMVDGWPMVRRGQPRPANPLRQQVPAIR